MTPNLLIRPLAADDYAGWKPLWDGYNAFYGRSGATALPDTVVAATWQRLLDAAEPMQALVAESRGQLLGLAHVVFHRSTIALGPSCYLQDLFTTEAARGQGVGRALIEAVYRLADQAGAARVYWQTHESNVTARRLYDAVAENSGFVVYRRAR
ncbi:MAG: GNAT family N-acetyltransferase [Paludibacterium sp.]|uniref:GNAT family N-acetyltransferase n=1 Tax=Paludibacterium sp. TaxID=1917523 RepID=UPI0025D852A0|nr:GNAT family N-acetyltransferase [Paludibacterium sp.]MBV8049372.1 GNAT family N-acetyltransferase [Paludibacterium sp.]